ncbi:hypothetical protein CGZ69_13865 [Streptomyces peucetius subsp. caesius ATCC 27952]|nr:hypothetical protein CGZ69_13865 [Streptomyces peucetius subsp. caesius ATCC 27952]
MALGEGCPQAYAPLEELMRRRLRRDCLYVPSCRLGLYVALRHWCPPGGRVLMSPVNDDVIFFMVPAAGLRRRQGPAQLLPAGRGRARAPGDRRCAARLARRRRAPQLPTGVRLLLGRRPLLVPRGRQEPCRGDPRGSRRHARPGHGGRGAAGPGLLPAHPWPDRGFRDARHARRRGAAAHRTVRRRL